MKKLKLKELKPETIFNDPSKAFTMVVSATRNSGKSNLIKHLYLDYWYPQNYFNSVCVFSNTLCTDFYSNFIPGKMLFDKYSKTVLNKCINTAKYYKSRGMIWRLLVIMDDCISSRDRYSEELNQIFTNGRHYNVSLVYITQKLSYCSTSWYNNLNCIVLMRNTSRSEKRYIAEKILNDVISDDIEISESKLTTRSVKIQNEICKDYRALFILPLRDGDKIFVYRAPKMT